MKIIVTGSTGLVGSKLVPALIADGHHITRLVRDGSSSGAAREGGATSVVHWDPEAGRVKSAELNGHDAAVHLAGENIAEGRWTEDKKRRIRDSRVNGTRLLAETLAQLSPRPKVLVCASAIGFYGDRGVEVLTEESGPGAEFLSKVCREWEAAAEPARQSSIRVVNLRLGIVLSPDGGALSKMLTPFKMGVGGKLGSGNQYMSWIALDDVIGAIKKALVDESLHGPVNAVAPHPVTNSEFTTTLGHVLNRPTLLPVPAFAARLAFGEMADALLLSSTRVEPARLQSVNYKFAHPELEGALRASLT